MAKYILKAFFLTTFSSTQKKRPKIYAVTVVLPLKRLQSDNITIELKQAILQCHFENVCHYFNTVG